jgi:hypothetical protein
VPRGVFAFACCGLGHCCRLGLGSLCVHVRLVMHSSTITRVYSAAAVELQVRCLEYRVYVGLLAGHRQ